MIAPNAVLIAERRLLDGAREDITDWMGKTMVGGSVGEIRGAAATKQGNSRRCFDQWGGTGEITGWGGAREIRGWGWCRGDRGAAAGNRFGAAAMKR
jgi:hypothetical protein